METALDVLVYRCELPAIMETRGTKRRRKGGNRKAARPKLKDAPYTHEVFAENKLFAKMLSES